MSLAIASERLLTHALCLGTAINTSILCKECKYEFTTSHATASTTTTAAADAVAASSITIAAADAVAASSVTITAANAVAASSVAAAATASAVVAPATTLDASATDDGASTPPKAFRSYPLDYGSYRGCGGCLFQWTSHRSK